MLIVERIEGSFAVCETPEKTFINIELAKLPPQVKAGNCLVPNGEGGYVIDYAEEERRRKKVRDLTAKLFKRRQMD